MKPPYFNQKSGQTTSDFLIPSIMHGQFACPITIEQFIYEICSILSLQIRQISQSLVAVIHITFVTTFQSNN